MREVDFDVKAPLSLRLVQGSLDQRWTLSSIRLPRLATVIGARRKREEGVRQTPLSPPAPVRKPGWPSWTHNIKLRRLVPFLMAPAFMALHAALIIALPAHRDLLSPLCQAVGPAVASAACWRVAVASGSGLRPNWLLAALAFLFWAAGSLLAVWIPTESSASIVDFSYFLCSVALLFAITAPENDQPKRLFLLMDGMQAILSAFLGFIVIFGAVPFSSEKLTPLSGSAVLWAYDVENACLAFLVGLRLFGDDRSPARRRFNRSMLVFAFSFGPMGSLYDHISPPWTSPMDIMLDPAFFLMAAMAGLPERDRATAARLRARLSAFIDSIGPVFLTAAALVVGAWITRQRPIPGIASILTAVAIYALRVSLLQARYLVTHRELCHTRDRLERLSLEDGLTGVGNRRAYDTALAKMWAEAERSQAPLSALMIDVDYFKAYNDRHGHPTGDACLIRIAEALRAVTQHHQGVVARYGGEEFAILLPNVAKLAASEVASTIRHTVASLDLTSRTGTAAPVTVSIGVATARRPGNAEALLLAVDDALYRAKRAGRNRVEVEAVDVATVDPDAPLLEAFDDLGTGGAPP